MPLTSNVTMPGEIITALNWTLGPYRILREIGRGQFGTVYEATEPGGRQIALKLVPIQGADSDEKVAAERQGAALQQRFGRTADHLVPEVLEHQRLDPYYAIAMELVGGQPLTSLIKAGRIRDDRAATIAWAICDFLVKAHEFTTDVGEPTPAVIVHGDLKPAHILLLADGTIRVLDFGIAKALAVRNTATTNLWSSVDYASPERLESGRVNQQVDFWSLGVILFEMLAGVRPYVHYEHSRSRLETAIRHQEPRLRVSPDVDPRLSAIVEKLLAPQIEHRYQSARQIADDLQAFLDRSPVVAFAEAARASQATVRIPPARSIARDDAIAVTEPISPLPTVPDPPVAVRPAAFDTQRHKPWIAALLSFLAPGFGQIYNRDYLRGIFWLIITPGFWVGSAGTFGWPFHLIAAYTAFKRAQAAEKGRPGWKMEHGEWKRPVNI